MTPLDEFFAPTNLIWFIAGMLSVQVWQWIKCKWKDYKHPEEGRHPMKKFNWFYIWTTFVMLVIVLVGVQSTRTYTFAENLARDTAVCQYQFNKALVASREINAEDRQLRLEWENATLKRVASLINLPENIKDNSVTDPAYVVYKSIVDQTYFERLGDIDLRRGENDARRALPGNQYPEPTCGKQLAGIK